MVVVGFLGSLAVFLKVVLPDVSPVSVAGIFRGQESELPQTAPEHRQSPDSCPLKRPATETGETLLSDHNSQYSSIAIPLPVGISP